MPDPTPNQARRLVETARANTERHEPELLTPTEPDNTAVLWRKLWRVGVRVKYARGTLIFENHLFHLLIGQELTVRVSDEDARNAVTVAAMEVVRKAWQENDGTGDGVGPTWLTVIGDMFDATDLAAAAVEAACRIREAGR